MFPLFFVFLFLSSMALPRDLIQIDWFRHLATLNPVSYLLEGIRCLLMTGWDGEALALGFGIAVAIAVVGMTAGDVRLAHEVGANMSSGRFWSGRIRRREADDHDVRQEPGAARAVDHLPAVLLRRVRGRTLAHRQRSQASTSPPATPRSSSSSCCFSRPPSAVCSRASASPATSRPDSPAASCWPPTTGRRSSSAMRSPRSARAFDHLVVAVRGRADRRHAGGGQRRRHLRHVGARRDRQPGGDALGGRNRDALPHDPGRPADADPVFFILFLAPVYVPLDLLSGWIHALASINPDDRVPRGRPRTDLRRADEGRARFRGGDRTGAHVLDLGAAWATAGRGGRLGTTARTPAGQPGLEARPRPGFRLDDSRCLALPSEIG